MLSTNIVEPLKIYHLRYVRFFIKFIHTQKKKEPRDKKKSNTKQNVVIIYSRKQIMYIWRTHYIKRTQNFLI